MCCWVPPQLPASSLPRTSSLSRPALQVPVPPGLAGRPYGEYAAHLALSQRMLALGLYRRKSENPGGWRVSALVCSLFPCGCRLAGCRAPWRCAVAMRRPCPPMLPPAHLPLALPPAGTRLSYVVCNPQWHEALEATDRVFVLRPREVAQGGARA